MSTTKRPFARLKKAAPASEGVDIQQWILGSSANDSDDDESEQNRLADWSDVLAMAGRMRISERLRFIKEELLTAGKYLVMSGSISDLKSQDLTISQTMDVFALLVKISDSEAEKLGAEMLKQVGDDVKENVSRWLEHEVKGIVGRCVLMRPIIRFSSMGAGLRRQRIDTHSSAGAVRYMRLLQTHGSLYALAVLWNLLDRKASEG